MNSAPQTALSFPRSESGNTPFHHIFPVARQNRAALFVKNARAFMLDKAGKNRYAIQDADTIYCVCK